MSQTILLTDELGNHIATGEVPEGQELPSGVMYNSTPYMKRGDIGIKGYPAVYTPAERLDYKIQFKAAGLEGAKRELIDAALSYDNADFETDNEALIAHTRLMEAVKGIGEACRNLKRPYYREPGFAGHSKKEE